MRKDMLKGRQETMVGLRSLENELRGINQMPDIASDEALEQIVQSIERAVTELERAIAK